MKLPRPVHCMISILTAATIIGVPLLLHREIFLGKSVDAVSQASMQLPDRPSGECVVLIRTSLHENTIDDWKMFFSDEYAVIFDDIHCMTANGDNAGIQLAERYQAQLPENQMTIHSENPTLLASKAEAGAIDAAVFSREMADALSLDLSNMNDITVIIIKP